MIYAVSANAREELVSTFRVSLVARRHRATTPTGFSIERYGKLRDVLTQAREWALYLKAAGHIRTADTFLVEDAGHPASQTLDAPEGFPFTAPMSEPVNRYRDYDIDSLVA